MSAIDLQAENQQLKLELEQLQQRSQKEKLRAEYERHLVKQIRQHAQLRNASDLPNVVHEHRPFNYFDGDLFLSAKRPEGGLYLLLGDFAGQGLAAAIGAVPVSQIFFSMANKSLSVGAMVTEMNATLYKLLPESMGFAACVIELDGKGDRVHLWSGGMSDVLWFEPAKGTSRRLSSPHSPLGSIDNERFDASFSRLYCRRGDSFLFATDGLLNARNPEGDEFGSARLQALFERDPEKCLPVVMGTFDAFIGNEQPNDDVSIAHVVCQAI